MLTLAALAALAVGGAGCKRTAPVAPDGNGARPELTPLEELPVAATQDLPPVVQEQIEAEIRAAREHSDDPARVARVAMLFHAHGFPDAARRWYNAALERAVRLEAAWQTFLYRYYISDLESRDGNPHAPAATMSLALSQQPEDIHGLLRLAMLMHVVYEAPLADESTRPTTAQLRRAYTRVIDRDNRIAPAHFGLGRIELAAGNLAEAAEHFKTAITLAPDYLEARDALIGVYEQMDRPQEAQTLREQAGPQRSDNGYVDPYMADFRRLTSQASARVEHALRLLKQGITAEAERELLAMIAENPQDAVALDALGTILMSKLVSAEPAERGALLREASERFRAAAQADPTFTQPKINFAMAVRASGDQSAALELMRSMARYVPHDWRVRYYLGDWLAGEAQERSQADGPVAAQPLYLEAIAELETSLELNPLNMFAVASLADVLQATGRYEEVHLLLRRAVQRTPDDPGIANKLALLLATSDVPSIRNPVEAVRIMLRVVEVTGIRIPEYLETLAISYEAMEDYEAAFRAISDAMDEAALAGDVDMKDRLSVVRARIEAKRMGQ
ncbi:MAG: tetratricopeptide repeat protein [Phycisphaerales bacterium]|nr:MAG: tetratricopeptide repeat protein [Phycisphaerales bacterium]